MNTQEQIQELEQRIAPLVQQLETLRRLKAKEDSAEYIRVNKITKEAVQLSSGDDETWFGMVPDFSEWLKSTGCTKRFAEWNERIYFTADLIAGRMPESPATIHELP